MQRKIKFRGKRVDNRKWVFGYFFETPLTNETGEADSFLSGPRKYQIADESGVVYEVDKETVGQFTGEFDGSVVEIYEGDILEGHNQNYSSFDEETKKWDKKGFETTVVFGEGAFIVEACTGDYDTTAIGWALEQDFIYKIIGNIHKDLV